LPIESNGEKKKMRNERRFTERLERAEEGRREGGKREEELRGGEIREKERREGERDGITKESSSRYGISCWIFGNDL